GAERFLRQRLAVLDELARLCPLAARGSPDGDRLDVLAAEDGAAAAASRMSPVMRDRRVPDAALAGGSDRGDLEAGAEPRLHRRFRIGARRAAQVIRGLEPHTAVVDHQRRERRGAADDDDGVAAAALAGNSEAAAGEGVVEAIGQRASTDDGELGGGGERTADERAEDEGNRRGRVRRARPGAALLEQQPRAEAGAADETAEHVFR